MILIIIPVWKWQAKIAIEAECNPLKTVKSSSRNCMRKLRHDEGQWLKENGCPKISLCIFIPIWVRFSMYKPSDVLLKLPMLLKKKRWCWWHCFEDHTLSSKAADCKPVEDRALFLQVTWLYTYQGSEFLVHSGCSPCVCGMNAPLLQGEYPILFKAFCLCFPWNPCV